MWPIGNVYDAECIVSYFRTLKGAIGARLVRNRIFRANHPYIPTRVVHREDNRISYPHLLSAVVLANSAQGTQAREKACGSPTQKNPSVTLPAKPCISEGSSAGPKHYHAPRKSTGGGKSTDSKGTDVVRNGANIAETQAFQVACLFESKSATFSFCAHTAYETVDVADFIVRSLRNRARSDVTLSRVAKLVKEFYDFTQAASPPLPFAGEESLIAMTKWLGHLGVLGKTVPGLGRYASKVYGEAIGIVFPTNRPAVLQASAIRGHQPKSAPCLETDFILALDAGANNRESPSGHRLYCAMFTLLALTSLRFGDTRMAQDLWLSETALCGPSINNKDKSRNLTQWATPLLSLRAKSKWYEPIVEFWSKIKPPERKFAPLFPHVTNDWKIEYKRPASYGIVQGRLDVLLVEFVFSKGCRLHSFRNWAPTVARQLRFPREEREVIGHWAPGSKMPDRYDRSVCAAELKL